LQQLECAAAAQHLTSPAAYAHLDTIADAPPPAAAPAAVAVEGALPFDIAPFELPTAFEENSSFGRKKGGEEPFELASQHLTSEQPFELALVHLPASQDTEREERGESHRTSFGKKQVGQAEGCGVGGAEEEGDTQDICVTRAPAPRSLRAVAVTPDSVVLSGPQTSPIPLTSPVLLLQVCAGNAFVVASAPMMMYKHASTSCMYLYNRMTCIYL
jgi:hypothetical protein